MLDLLLCKGPGDIKEPKIPVTKHAGPHALLKGEGDEIWHPNELKNIDISEAQDPRETPEYEMKFKQSVGTEDVFFGVIIIYKIICNVGLNYIVI